MKTNGFIMDKYLSKVGKMLQQKGINCKIVDLEADAVIAIAIKEKRVYRKYEIKIRVRKYFKLKCT